MSRYCVVETQFKDGDALTESLMETGHWHREQIEEWAAPQHLRGYKGDERKEVAHIIVRRRHIGSASNDLGFVKNENGNYEAIISEYDSGKFNKTWLGKLTANYAYYKTKKDQVSRRRTVSRTFCENGHQRIVVSGYR